MDLMTIAGFVLGVGAVWYVLASGGILGLLYNINAAVLVFGGVIGATLITYPWRLIKRLPKCASLVLFPPRMPEYGEIIETFENIAKKARKDGISQSLLEGVPPDTFFVRAISLLIDGFDVNFIRETLHNEIIGFKKRHTQISDIFKSMGAYAPIFGLLGTLIGVVQVLRNLSDPASMGHSMAIAITTTFYGIFSTNFIFLPVAGKLSVLTDKEALIKQLILEGTISLQKGEIPSVVKKRLQSFLADYEKNLK
ncbi:MotA/TolQ/ExbB proton channel family protein [bacterium]|nr:motility protein A [bacterium]MBU3955634.1 MotA/TolQ/ExbB proton channel family protein [bacterium]